MNVQMIVYCFIYDIKYIYKYFTQVSPNANLANNRFSFFEFPKCNFLKELCYGDCVENVQYWQCS